MTAEEVLQARSRGVMTMDFLPRLLFIEMLRLKINISKTLLRKSERGRKPSMMLMPARNLFGLTIWRNHSVWL